MKKNPNSYLWLILLLVLFDKFSKFLLQAGGFPVLVNNNIGLGILLNPWIVALVSTVLLIVIFYWYWHYPSLELAILFAGSMANITDRIIWGGVIDYLRIPGLFVINVPDILICSSLLFLLMKLLRIRLKWPLYSNLKK